MWAHGIPLAAGHSYLGHTAGCFSDRAKKKQRTILSDPSQFIIYPTVTIVPRPRKIACTWTTSEITKKKLIKLALETKVAVNYVRKESRALVPFLCILGCGMRLFFHCFFFPHFSCYFVHFCSKSMRPPTCKIISVVKDNMYICYFRSPGLSTLLLPFQIYLRISFQQFCAPNTSGSTCAPPHHFNDVIKNKQAYFFSHWKP